jgi:hypothetical protein
MERYLEIRKDKKDNTKIIFLNEEGKVCFLNKKSKFFNLIDYSKIKVSFVKEKYFKKIVEEEKFDLIDFKEECIVNENNLLNKEQFPVYTGNLKFVNGKLKAEVIEGRYKRGINPLTFEEVKGYVLKNNKKWHFVKKNKIPVKYSLDKIKIFLDKKFDDKAEYIKIKKDVIVKYNIENLIFYIFTAIKHLIPNEKKEFNGIVKVKGYSSFEKIKKALLLKKEINNLNILDYCSINLTDKDYEKYGAFKELKWNNEGYWVENVTIEDSEDEYRNGFSYTKRVSQLDVIKKLYPEEYRIAKKIFLEKKEKLLKEIPVPDVKIEILNLKGAVFTD